MSKKIAFLGKKIAFLACILAIWKVGSMHTKALFVPPPEQVFKDFYLAISNGTLLLAIQYSLRRIFIAAALAAGLSIPVGLLVYNTRWATDTLNDFIATAKVLDGAIIEIAGNTDADPETDPTDELNKKLSEQRAETVKKFFVMNGIDASRIVTVGNGSSNPIVPNDTPEHEAMNRRTDVSFKLIEG